MYSFSDIDATLNNKQRAVLEYIVSYMEDNGFAPSVREIADTLRMSKSNIPHLLKALEKAGYIDIKPRTPRGISLKKAEIPDAVSIPLIGTIAAGVPVFAAENFETNISISKDLVPNGELFALRVSGTSMIGANIFDDDIAIIKREHLPNNGDIVAALVDGEATLKRFYQNNDVIWLMPENPDFQPIVITEEQGDILVLGRLVATIRKY